MAQSDVNPFQENVYDNLQYLMSGPSGLGQNFAGYSSYTTAYLTGTPRQPFTVPISTSPAPTFYATESIGNITVQSGRNITVDFVTPAATPPFSQGDSVTISGVDPSFYNDYYGGGVAAGYTGNVQLQTRGSYTWPAYVSGGTITKDYSTTDPLDPYYISTDANARVTIYGPTDRVFISAQTNLDFTYTASVASEFNLRVMVNRYQGFIDRSDPNNLDYLFGFDGTVSEQVFNYTPGTSGSYSIPEVIFTSVIDSPNYGYYWYILEFRFDYISGDVKPGVFTVGLRGLTAQAVKE